MNKTYLADTKALFCGIRAEKGKSMPTKPWRVAHVEALENFRLKVRFLDGLEGIVDMAALVHSAGAGVFAVLAQTALFEQVHLTYGVVTWPSGPDLAPGAMYSHIKAEGIWRLA